MTPATDLARLADHPELAVLVTQGTEYWRSGQIRLAVNGVGVAEVDHRRSGEFRRYSERLSREEIEQLAADLTALGFTELESSRGEYQPDEQTVQRSSCARATTCCTTRICPPAIAKSMRGWTG